jgi:hypothetical protein
LRDGKNGGAGNGSECGIVFAELFVRSALGGATGGTRRHMVQFLLKRDGETRRCSLELRISGVGFPPIQGLMG